MSNGSVECTGSCTWKFSESDGQWKIDVDGCVAGSGCVCQNPNTLSLRAAVEGEELETPCIPEALATPGE